MVGRLLGQRSIENIISIAKIQERSRGICLRRSDRYIGASPPIGDISVTYRYVGMSPAEGKTETGERNGGEGN